MAFYKLPDSSLKEWKYRHHEDVLPRVISSPRSREAANTYIYRASFQDKMLITRMLNEWNRDNYTTEEAGTVIRPEAVPVIKDWLSAAQDKEVTVARKLLSHLSDEKKRADNNETESSSPKPSPRKISTSGGEPKRPTLRPRTSITNGSFYPQWSEGRGNNTGVFNIVTGPPRPKTQQHRAPTKAQPLKRHQSQPMVQNAPTFNPVNRSSVFGEVIRPVPQDQVNLDGGQSCRTRPYTQGQNRRSSNGSRPTTQGQGRRTTANGSRPSTQNKSRKNTANSSRQGTEEHLQRLSSAEKLKFSSNLHNMKVEEIEDRSMDEQKPMETDRTEQQYNTCRSHKDEEKVRPKTVQYHAKQDQHSQIGLKKHWPGRRYYSTQFMLC